jgi:hypothetical protein
VKIGVANLAVGIYPVVEVFLRGHPGPGYSLGYDPGEQVVRGTLPDGGYTLKLISNDEQGSSGSLNFAVRGAPVEGLVVSLYPNVSLSVNVTREFGTGEPSEGIENGEGNIVVSQASDNVTIALSPVEQFGMGPTVMSQPERGQPEGRLTLRNVPGGTYWMQISAINCYPYAASWGGGDVLHQPITVGAEGASTPIELTLRNDGAEVSGKLQFPEGAGARNSNETAPIMPLAFVYFVPIREDSGQLRRTQVWQNGNFDEKQIAPGTYLVLAFDHLNTEIGTANSELLRKYESKGVLLELSASQKVALPAPLAVVSEP